MKNAVNQDNWFKRNLVRLYLGFVILILLIICIGTLCDTFYYLTGEKTEATVLGVSNYRVKTGSRHQTSSKATKIKIRYNVNGEEFEKEIKLTGWYKPEKGNNIKVSYNPKNPEKVYLFRGIYQKFIFSLLWGAFVGLQIKLLGNADRKTSESASESINESANKS